jgi:hypothetical protein
MLQAFLQAMTQKLAAVKRMAHAALIMRPLWLQCSRGIKVVEPHRICAPLNREGDP